MGGRESPTRVDFPLAISSLRVVLDIHYLDSTFLLLAKMWDEITSVRVVTPP